MRAKGKHVSHHQAQAYRLRRMAARTERLIIRLAHHRNSLLAQADKLEAKSKMPKEVGKVRTIGFQ